MNIISSIIYIFAVVFTIAWGILIREKTKKEKSSEGIYNLFGVLQVVSLILIPTLSLSSLHLLWMFPASFFLGFLGAIPPFSFLLSPLASIYGSIWSIGLKVTRGKD